MEKWDVTTAASVCLMSGKIKWYSHFLIMSVYGTHIGASGCSTEASLLRYCCDENTMRSKGQMNQKTPGI